MVTGTHTHVQRAVQPVVDIETVLEIVIDPGGAGEAPGHVQRTGIYLPPLTAAIEAEHVTALTVGNPSGQRHDEPVEQAGHQTALSLDPAVDALHRTLHGEVLA